MAISETLVVNLVTPKGVVAHTDTNSVRAPGELGEFQLLGGHVPMLSALKAGVITVGTAPKPVVHYAVSSGYLRVDPSGMVEILVEQAVPAIEVNEETAKRELDAAKQELDRWGDRPMDAEHLNVQQRAAWAQARLDALKAQSGGKPH